MNSLVESHVVRCTSLSIFTLNSRPSELLTRILLNVLTSPFYYLLMGLKTAGRVANSVDPD